MERCLLCPEMGRVAVARVDFDDKTNMAELRGRYRGAGVGGFSSAAECRASHPATGAARDWRTAIGAGAAKSPEQRNRLERTIAVLEEPPQQPKINDFVLANARLAGRDAKGNAVLWADTVGPDGRSGRTAAWIITDNAQVIPAPEPVTEWAPHAMLTDHSGRLFLARYQKGLGVLNRAGNVTHLSDDTDIPFDEILGQDHDGRVYLRNRWHVAAINLDVADTRRTLPVTITELSASRSAACLDSKGHTVAKLAGAEHQFLSALPRRAVCRFPRSRRAAPGSQTWRTSSPCAKGALAAQEQPGRGRILFRRATWSVHHSFRAMIEKRYADLVPADRQRPQRC